MKSLKALLVLLLATTTMSYAKSTAYRLLTEKIIVNGLITGDLKGKNKVFITDLNEYRDTAVVKNGKYTFVIPFKGAKTFFMNFECEMGYRPYTVVIDKPGTLQVNFNIPNSKLEMSGLETPTIYNEFSRGIGLIYKEIDKTLISKYGTAFPNSGDSNYNNVMLDRDRLYKEKMIVLLRSQVIKYPNEYATGYILADNTSRYPLSLQEELYNKLSAKGKATAKGKEVLAMINGTKSSAIGSKIADFTLNDPDGKAISFSQFKDKYVLIDFWASWCGPCRASFPRMKQIYKTFHENGLEIISVSIDADKTNWLKAVAEEKLPWSQVLDTKNIAKSRFAVSAIPNLFLITPDGKILLEELGADPKGGGEIEKQLEALFHKKVTSTGL